MAIDNPSIAAYKPFYIQKGDTLYDTLTNFGFIAKGNPYPALPKAKKPYAIDWAGEDGEEEYTDTLLDVEFYIRATGATAASDVRGALNSFFNVVKNGTIKVYDSYTAIGRKEVRYVGFEEESFSVVGNTARLIFKVTFKCNAPTVLCKLNNAGTAIEDL